MTILEDVEHADTDYLGLGGRRRSPVGKAAFGSVTQSVLLEASIPDVTVLRQE